MLILMKVLGIGMLFVADMCLKVRGCWIESVIKLMLGFNQNVVQLLLEYGVIVCMDVIGFGLVGYLLEMLKG